MDRECTQVIYISAGISLLFALFDLLLKCTVDLWVATGGPYQVLLMSLLYPYLLPPAFFFFLLHRLLLLIMIDAFPVLWFTTMCCGAASIKLIL